MPTLHLTNGDAAAARLRAAELSGDVVPWRDVLHDGPVPPDEDERGFRDTRAEFLASRGWTSVTAAAASMAARDQRLSSATGTDEVVLWFEPDLYDQLQLAQLLARIARRPLLARPAVSIVPADCFLGEVLPNRVSMLHTARRSLTRRDLDQGLSAWGAFTASTPDALAAMADRLDEEVVARTYSGCWRSTPGRRTGSRAPNGSCARCWPAGPPRRRTCSRGASWPRAGGGWGIGALRGTWSGCRRGQSRWCRAGTARA
jgi:hypothetical protein